MQDFSGRLAVVTGGGSGMGREMVIQLAAEGCHVATCDVQAEPLDETRDLASAVAPNGTRITTFMADVSDESQLVAFRDAAIDEHDTDALNLLFNNAGIGGGGSFVADSREEWDRTFGVCWGGMYLGTRTFLPMLLASDEGHIVNTSSVNGFWASLGPDNPHTSYSAAKFAIKGFTEALIADFRLNAPHLSASVVMPGHIGTSIVLNSMRLQGMDPKEIDDEQIVGIRAMLARRGLDMSAASDEDIRQGMQMQGEFFRDTAPTTAAQAATIILDGVKAGQWRILVGDDAVALDQAVRDDAEGAYDEAFWHRLQANGIFSLGI